jgi:Predicted pyridoxal phosphate-dependent enzyme apparently involved in regulation of cell wall biogenesis
MFVLFTGAKYGVAVCNGTAALHAAMFGLGIGPGDEVIVPPMTFAATANCVLYQGGRPVFVDVEEDTLLIDPTKIEEAITPHTKAIIGVDYAGQPCDWDALRPLPIRTTLRWWLTPAIPLGLNTRDAKWEPLPTFLASVSIL